MTILLDTCEFLWFVSGSDKFPAKWKEEIENPDNSVYLSVVSLWEILVKESIGKLSFPKAAAQYVPEQRDAHRIQSLDLDERAVKLLAGLPAIHRDPFDRMLVCQAQAGGLRLASSDATLAKYSVQIL